MRALTWQGNEHVEVTDVPDPVIQEPNGIIIRVTSTAICGSDLHLYGVLGPFLKPGDVLGHEPMGIVGETGPDIVSLRPGDRVVVPFNISCGHCWMCQRGLYAQCETTQVRGQDKGAALFGYTSLYGSVPGGRGGPGPRAAGSSGPVRRRDHQPGRTRQHRGQADRADRSSRLIEAGQKATGLLPDPAAAKLTDRAAVDRLDALHTAVKAVRRGGTDTRQARERHGGWTTPAASRPR